MKVCYGRPSSRGRMMLGGEAVPYGKLWRTGANEPTIFFTPVAAAPWPASRCRPASIRSIPCPTRPSGRSSSTARSRSGAEEDNYTPEVQAQEVGRGKVKSETLTHAVETFTIRSEGAGEGPRSCSSGRRPGSGSRSSRPELRLAASADALDQPVDLLRRGVAGAARAHEALRPRAPAARPPSWRRSRRSRRTRLRPPAPGHLVGSCGQPP